MFLRRLASSGFPVVRARVLSRLLLTIRTSSIIQPKSFFRTMCDYSLPAKPAWSTPITVGDTVPSVTFKTRVRIESDDENPFDWKDMTSEDYFKGKRVVLFALPGKMTTVIGTLFLIVTCLLS
jgi:hypothetical protein